MLICSVRMWCIVKCSLLLPFSCLGIDIFVVSIQLFCHVQGVQVKVYCDGRLSLFFDPFLVRVFVLEHCLGEVLLLLVCQVLGSFLFL